MSEKEVKKTTVKKSTTKKAPTKKTTPKKESSKPKVEEKTTVKKVEEVKARPKKRQINRDEMVICRNLKSGGLFYKSNRTGAEYRWNAYGDEVWLDVGELMNMKASQPKFLRDGWILVDDAEISEHLGVLDLYNEIANLVDLTEFFTLNVKEAKNILLKLPKGVQKTISEIAKKKVMADEIENYQILRMLEKELNVELIQLAN